MFLASVIVLVVSYLIGSFPTAYLLVRWKTQQDVRRLGSGNVGALNSYEVTRSKFVGLSVLVIDLVKGGSSIMITRWIFGESFLLGGIAATGVILGHNYPCWLEFRGGRGLAPAAGAVLLIHWPFVVLWSVLWFLTYLLTRKVHVGNLVAIVLAPFISLALSTQMVRWGILSSSNVGLFIPFAFLLCGLLFLRHIDPLREILSRSS